MIHILRQHAQARGLIIWLVQIEICSVAAHKYLAGMSSNPNILSYLVPLAFQ